MNRGSAQRLRFVITRGLRHAELDRQSFDAGFAEEPVHIGIQVQKLGVLGRSEWPALREADDVRAFCARRVGFFGKHVELAHDAVGERLTRLQVAVVGRGLGRIPLTPTPGPRCIAHSSTF